MLHNRLKIRCDFTKLCNGIVNHKLKLGPIEINKPWFSSILKHMYDDIYVDKVFQTRTFRRLVFPLLYNSTWWILDQIACYKLYAVFPLLYISTWWILDQIACYTTVLDEYWTRLPVINSMLDRNKSQVKDKRLPQKIIFEMLYFYESKINPSAVRR